MPRHLKLATDTSATVPLIARPSEGICQTCKMPLREDVINHVRAGFDEAKKKTILAPCPACSKDKAARAQAKAIARLFGGSRIPWRANNWSFDTHPQDADQRAKKLMMQFVQLHLSGDQINKRFFFLVGRPGLCKTGLALCALKEVLKAGQSGLYIMTAELMVKLQASFHSDTAYSEDTMLEALYNVAWLVLDDLAVESGRDASVSAHTLKSLYLIIQARADRGLYTIFTSNLSLADLERYWRPKGVQDGRFHEGLRIVDRLREYCLGCTVEGRNQRG